MSAKERHDGAGTFTAAENPEDFVAGLEQPRRILIMVKAGAPVDDVIEELSSLMDEGDILIDGGNSHFADTKRRAAVCAERGLRFLGVGGKIFEEWNSGDLESFLIEITAKVLAKADEKTGGPLVDVILDEAEQKGTGRWTAIDALELGVPLTGITEAVFARTLSALRDQRKAASTTLAGPVPGAGEDRTDLVEDIRRALYASKVVAYAQGFAQMRAASATNGWDLDLGAMATIWRAVASSGRSSSTPSGMPTPSTGTSRTC